MEFCDIVLAKAQVSAGQQAIKDAEELLRINRLKLKTGTGLPVDVLRAEAELALKQQTLLTALNGFYNASVALTITLHLDPTVMLVPRKGSMRETTLVREDLPIDTLLVTAVQYRPDLQAIRTLLAAAEADTSATTWGGLGPQVLASRTFGPKPPAHATPDTEYRQSIYTAGGGFNWSLATFGRIKTATANANIAGLEVDRQLEQVQGAGRYCSAGEHHRKEDHPDRAARSDFVRRGAALDPKDLQTGTGLTLDVLVAADAAYQARLHQASAIVRYNQAEINLLAALGPIDQANVEGASDYPK